MCGDLLQRGVLLIQYCEIMLHFSLYLRDSWFDEAGRHRKHVPFGFLDREFRGRGFLCIQLIPDEEPQHRGFAVRGAFSRYGSYPVFPPRRLGSQG